MTRQIALPEAASEDACANSADDGVATANQERERTRTPMREEQENEGLCENGARR